LVGVQCFHNDNGDKEKVDSPYYTKTYAEWFCNEETMHVGTSTTFIASEQEVKMPLASLEKMPIPKILKNNDHL